LQGGFSYGAAIAPTGQTAAQAPHSTQSSLIAKIGLPSLIAPTGQVAAQLPQAMHSSLIL